MTTASTTAADVEKRREQSLKVLSSPDAILEPRVLDSIREFTRAGGGPEHAISALAHGYRGLPTIANLLCGWLEEAKLRTGSTPEVARESVRAVVDSTARRVAAETFSPARADTLLNSCSLPPPWIGAMWRALVYELSERHPGSTFLSYVINGIAEAGEYYAELVALNTATSHFKIFNMILTETVTALLSSPDESTFQSLLPGFRRMCSANEHAYLYTQLVLRDLANRGVSGAMRLSQELFVEAKDSRSAAVAQHLKMILLQESASEEHVAVLRVIKSALVNNSFTPVDVITLYQEYRKETPPPIEFLRDFQVLDLLVRQLFDPVTSVSDAHKEKYVYLLAYASSRSTAGGPGGPEFDAVVSALSAVVPVCKRSTTLSQLRNALPSLREHLRHPIIAMGIVHWTGRNLLDQDFYLIASNELWSTIHMDLLREIVAQHPPHRPAIFQLMISCFSMQFPSDLLHLQLELKKSSLNIFVELIIAGFICPVLKRFGAWCEARIIDYSLVRHFLLNLLCSIEPPYSPEFMGWMVNLLSRKGVSEAFVKTDTTAHSTLQAVHSFLAFCKEHISELQRPDAELVYSLLRSAGYSRS